MLMQSPGKPAGDPGFSFLTNHAHVILIIAQEKDVRMRDIARTIGITERAVQRIVEELTASGYLVVTKEGRRNRYEVVADRLLRQLPTVLNCSIGDLIRLTHRISTI